MGGCIAKPHIVVDRCWGGREGGRGWERSGGGEELGRGAGTPRSPRGNPRPRPIRGRGRGGHHHRCPHPRERGCLSEIPKQTQALRGGAPPHLRHGQSRGGAPPKGAQGQDAHHQPPPPPPPQQSRLTPRLTPKKTLNPTQIPPLTHLSPQAIPKLRRHYGTRKRALGSFKTATMAEWPST